MLAVSHLSSVVTNEVMIMPRCARLLIARFFCINGFLRKM